MGLIDSPRQNQARSGKEEKVDDKIPSCLPSFPPTLSSAETAVEALGV